MLSMKRLDATSESHLHLKKGSTQHTTLFKGRLSNQYLYKIWLQFLKKGRLPNTLPFLRVVRPILKAKDTSFYAGKVDDLYLYPLLADPKVLKKCSQSVEAMTAVQLVSALLLLFWGQLGLGGCHANHTMWSLHPSMWVVGCE